jgi:prepilin-type N-terminal cleavage/methylation domain-containing protein
MRKAFTLIELLVVIAIIAVLVTILVPVVINALGESERTVCTSNLKVVGKAYQDYAHLNPDSIFPKHVTAPTALADAQDDTAAGIIAAGSNVLDATLGTNAMNTLWVMIAKGMIGQEAFHCPGDEGWTARTATNLYGWGALTEFSYGVHFPYQYDVIAQTTDNPADPADKFDADDDTVEPDAKKGDYEYLPTWVIMADRNPIGAVDGVVGSIEHSNHQGEDGGCAVVSRVGNATFHDSATDSMAGFGDNIYTDITDGNAAGSAATAASFPEARTDTVISPTMSRN